MTGRPWKDWAAELEIGKSVRVQHEDEPDRSLLVSRDENGISAWCFRCGKVGWLPNPPETLEQKLARISRQRTGDATLPSGCALPYPPVYDIDQWPEGAKLWIYKAGLSRADAGALQLYWHAPSDRVVIPVLSASDGGPTFYQARAYQKGRTPKYLGPTPKPPTLCASWGHAPNVCLTEDLLSAIKIGLAGGEGWCLLGTRISDYLMGKLLARKCLVLVCLDPDPPGQKGAASIMRQLKAYDVPCRNVVMPKDPKLIHLSELRSYVCPSMSQ